MYEKILIAYDGSPLSDQAMEAAKNHVDKEAKTEIHIINVTRSTGPKTNAQLAQSIHKDLIEEKHAEIAHLKELFPGENTDVSIKILIAEANENPGKLICRYAEENNIELIVMGSRGLGNVRRILLGSVSNYVVQRAKCPIFIIK